RTSGVTTVRIIRLEARPKFVLHVEFDDGVAGEIDLSSRLFGPMFEPLRDIAYFEKAALDDFGAPCWPNGADLAPDALHRQLCARADGASVTP
ncbi:MAG: DUF2442 domain-containing protein, partial [Deltaproteobacteria bacterium]